MARQSGGGGRRGASTDIRMARRDDEWLFRRLSALDERRIVDLRRVERQAVSGARADAPERCDRAALTAQRRVAERAARRWLRRLFAARFRRSVPRLLRSLS